MFDGLKRQQEQLKGSNAIKMEDSKKKKKKMKESNGKPGHVEPGPDAIGSYNLWWKFWISFSVW